MIIIIERDDIVLKELFSMLARTLLVLTVLFFMVKLMGKKQVSQMNMFDYIIGITLGSIVADVSMDIEKNLLSGISCILLYCFISIIISELSLKSIKFREFFNGKDTIIIERGKLLKKNMKSCKITVNNLETEARLMGYFSLDEIDYAIMENNGKISFKPKEKNKPLEKGDYLDKVIDDGLVYNLIIDGEYVVKNMEKVGKDKKWINHYLKVNGYKFSDILLLTIDGNDKVMVYKR